MEQLRQSIAKEQERIERDLKTPDKKQEFYRDFFFRYQTTIDDLLKADYIELAIAILARKDTSDDIDTITRTVQGNRTIFEYLDKDGLEAVLSLLETLKAADLYDELYDILKHERIFILKNPFGKEAKVIRNIKEMLQMVNISQPAFADFMALAKNHNDDLMDVCRILASLKQIKHDLVEYEEELSETEEEMGIKLKNKYRVRAINEHLKDEWDIPALTQVIKEVRKSYEQKEQATKNKVKNLNREKGAYDRLEQQLLYALSSKEIKNPEDFIAKISSADVRKQALRIIYNHNQKYYSALTEEYHTLAANDKYHYQALLTKYGITPDSYDVETIMQNPISEVEQMLKDLSKLKISSQEAIVNVLQQSDLSTLATYTSLIDKGIITTEAFKNHPDLLNKDSHEYSDFMRNISLLQEKKINPYYISAVQDIFTTHHSLFRKNIETMEDYHLIDSMSAGMNSGFLSQNDLEQSIDTLLELGFESNLEEYPEILNYADKFDRLKVAKFLNIPLTTTEEIFKLLTSDKFFLADEDIPDYLYNATSFNLPRINQALSNQELSTDLEGLYKYTATKRTYNINGVIISKNKVARNLSEISETTDKESRLLHAVIAGSYLTDEELSQLTTTLIPSRETNLVKQKI